MRHVLLCLVCCIALAPAFAQGASKEIQIFTRRPPLKPGERTFSQAFIEDLKKMYAMHGGMYLD